MSSETVQSPPPPRTVRPDAGVPEWKPYVEAYNDTKLRAKVSRGDLEGYEYLASGPGLAANIAKFWLAERLTGDRVPAELDACMRAILARCASPQTHQVFGPNEKLMANESYVDSPLIVVGPDGVRYWLSLGPFYYQPSGDPSERQVKHPGPRRPGDVAVVRVPDRPKVSTMLPTEYEAI